MNQENKSGLFAEFPEISTQQWEEIIHQDLKGADYEKKLIWNTLEGLKIRPYYRSEDQAKLKHLQTLPGQYPFVRGNREKDNNWEIRQDIDENDPQKANTTAVDALKRAFCGTAGLCGVDNNLRLTSIRFDCPIIHFFLRQCLIDVIVVQKYSPIGTSPVRNLRALSFRRVC